MIKVDKFYAQIDDKTTPDDVVAEIVVAYAAVIEFLSGDDKEERKSNAQSILATMLHFMDGIVDGSFGERRDSCL